MHYTIVVGQTHPNWTFEWRSVNQSTGKSVLKDFTGLSSTNLSVILHSTTGGTDILGNGVFSILSNPGWLEYQPDARDVAIAGAYQVFVTALFGSAPDISLPFDLTILGK